jgi:Holliday junction resolvase RusA-like endonuclease
MATLPQEFKKKVADLYLTSSKRLEELDPATLESFTSKVLQLIEQERKGTESSHDLEVLEQSMKHLKHDSAQLKNYKPNTDDYDFTRNDVKNLLNSTKRWLKTEGLI